MFFALLGILALNICRKCTMAGNNLLLKTMNMKVGFIGAGNLAVNMVKGFVKSGNGLILI